MIGQSRSQRDEVPDLLTRPPSGTREFVTDWALMLVDPVRQLQQLAELHALGFLSPDEFERYKHHVSTL